MLSRPIHGSWRLIFFCLYSTSTSRILSFHALSLDALDVGLIRLLYFCSVALLFLKSIAKLKFKNMPGDSRLKDRAQSDWVSETCRNIQVQVIKTTAFNNRLALKDSFGMDYSKLFPGSIFNPPSYSENFVSSSSGRWPIYLF